MSQVLRTRVDIALTPRNALASGTEKRMPGSSVVRALMEGAEGVVVPGDRAPPAEAQRRTPWRRSCPARAEELPGERREAAAGRAAHTGPRAGPRGVWRAIRVVGLYSGLLGAAGRG